MKDVRVRADDLIVINELARIGADDRQVRRARSSGELQRIRRGAYVGSRRLAEADDDARYDLRIAAVLATRRSSPVLSHHSAARLWALPIVNPWPYEVHLTVHPGSGSRTRNAVAVHRHELLPADVVELDTAEVVGVRVTALARTLVDLARTAPFRDAVAAIDAALHRGMVSRPVLLDELGRCSATGSTRAARAIEFASPLAMLPGESLSRVLIHELGFPAPELQHEFVTADGRRYADFWWERLGLIGEFDGRGKYFDPQYTDGRSAQEVFWQEKLRENELRELGVTLTRWSWGDLNRLEPFIHRLEAAGLRRVTRYSLPPPLRAAIVPVPADSARRNGHYAPERALSERRTERRTGRGPARRANRDTPGLQRGESYGRLV
jgi:hypothetical protein